MENEEILQKLRSVKLTLMAHPDNEPNSEFEDQISTIEEIEQALNTSNVVDMLKPLKRMCFDCQEPLLDNEDVWCSECM